MGEKRKEGRIGEEGNWERHKEHGEHRDKSEPVTKFFIKNNMRFLFSFVLLKKKRRRLKRKDVF